MLSSDVSLATAERHARQGCYAHFPDEDIKVQRVCPAEGCSGGAELRSAAYHSLVLLLPPHSCTNCFGSIRVAVWASSAEQTVSEENGGAPVTPEAGFPS